MTNSLRKKNFLLCCTGSRNWSSTRMRNCCLSRSSKLLFVVVFATAIECFLQIAVVDAFHLLACTAVVVVLRGRLLVHGAEGGGYDDSYKGRNPFEYGNRRHGTRECSISCLNCHCEDPVKGTKQSLCGSFVFYGISIFCPCFPKALNIWNPA